MSNENEIAVGNLKPRIQFEGDGTQKEFQFFFTIYEPENVEVYLDDVLQTSGYALQQDKNVGGGIVIFEAAPSAGTLVTIYRNLELKRTTDFKEGGPFRSSNVNNEFDYQLSCLEQLEDSIGRTVTFPPYAPTNLNVNLPMPDSGKAIIWDGNGQSLINSEYDFDQVINLSNPNYANTQASAAAAASSAVASAASSSQAEQYKNTAQAQAQQAENSASAAAASAAAAAAASVNSLYNQNSNMAVFDLVLQDGVSIYSLPPITEAVAVTIDASGLKKTANVVTFELVLLFNDGIYQTVAFPDSVTWLNGKVPSLSRNGTWTKLLVFRSFDGGQNWIAGMEGGW